MKIEGSTILVSGASSGIGAALARQLAARGATVGLVARRADRLREVLDDCRRDAPGSRMWAVDLADPDRAATLAIEAWDAFGHLDALVNNAAIPKRRAITELSASEIDEVMRVNFYSPARMSLAILPRLLERGGGLIVNVSSLGGRLGIAHEAAYCASKFALCGWSEAMAIDLWKTAVDIKLVLPGPIDTEIWDRPDNDAPLFDGPKVPAADCASGIVAAMESDTFEHYVPDLKAIVEGKGAAIDQFLAGSSAMMKD